MTKYIPNKLLGEIQEAEVGKRSVVEILQLLGVAVSPSKLLGDNEINPSDSEVLEDNSVIPNDLLGDKQINPNKTRRHKGQGSGSIHRRIITRNAKDYPQAYYHYEFWSEGDRLVKSSKYIPKRLLKRVQEMEREKAAVGEILQVLRVLKLSKQN